MQVLPDHCCKCFSPHWYNLNHLHCPWEELNSNNTERRGYRALMPDLRNVYEWYHKQSWTMYFYIWMYMYGYSPQRRQIYTVPKMSWLYEKTPCLLQIECLENLHFNNMNTYEFSSLRDHSLIRFPHKRQKISLDIKIISLQSFKLWLQSSDTLESLNMMVTSVPNMTKRMYFS